MIGSNSLTTTNIHAVKGSSSSTVKLLCSYGGKILPRYPDGELRYVGGETRIVAFDRSLPFSGLLTKLSALYGSPATLRCKLPGEDLDLLVSITSSEDLANVIEEYDRANRDGSKQNFKVRAFLSPERAKNLYPLATAKSTAGVGSRYIHAAMANRCVHHTPPPQHQPVRFPISSNKSAGDKRYCACCCVHGNPTNSSN